MLSQVILFLHRLYKNGQMFDFVQWNYFLNALYYPAI